MKNKKIISMLFAVLMILICFPVAVSAISDSDETSWTPEYTVSIPEYIQATDDKETNISYQITASDVHLSERKSLSVTVEYTGMLKNSADESVALEYNLYSNDGILKNNDSILFVAKSTDLAENEFHARLASKPQYAGVYTDPVTFNVFVEDRAYTAAEIENDPYLFAIGKTDPSYVVARFNENYTSVTIFKNGSQSDGLMMDWDSKSYTSSPMYKKRGTLKNVTVNEGTQSLGNYAFYNCSKITNVEQLPETLTDIGIRAFYSCSSLTDIAIPEGITVIKDETFRGCKKLTEVSLPSSLEEISWAAFWSCNLSEIDFPSGLLKIDSYAFADNNNLLIKAFPEGLKYIGSNSFQNCYPNTSYFVPASVEYIGTQAFYQAWNGGKNTINYIKVDENNPFYKDIDGVLFTKDGTVLMDYPSKKEDTSYAVPDGVLVIDDYALAYCHNIKKLTLPDGLREIKEFAFYNCFVNELVLPNTLRIIEKNAFYACSNLINIVLSNTLEEIGYEAFSGTEIQQITIPASVMTLDNYALEGMQYLKEIIVDSDNENYASVDGVLFNKDLTVLMQYPSNKDDTEYTIPEGTLSVSLTAFWHNTASAKFGKNLKVLNVPNSVTTIPLFSGNSNYGYMKFYCLEAINISEGSSKYSSIDGVLFDKEKTKMIYYPCGKKETTYTIPETVNTVGKYAFMYNYTLTEVIISNNVTALGETSFYECSSLTNVIIGDGITSIGEWTFYDCDNLTSVTIPSSVTSIDENAFWGCLSLKTIYGSSGSYAETWAKANRYTFVPVSE
ncbi:MAG: leucine-rich repeat domain-containing protein [Oscillospiraceae bacterium]|nr:leucine-rich repeat domain-containing protein [Oscillospiraceae bacterium]